jgi:large subunit ribosomal protein L6
MKLLNPFKLFKLKFPKETRIFFFNNKFIVNSTYGTVVFTSFLNKNKYIINLTKNSLSISNKNYVGCHKLLKLNNLLQSIIFGVNFLFSKKLSLVGIGFRIWFKHFNNDKVILIKIGFSKDIYIPIPKNMLVYALRPTLLLIRGLQKNKINQFCNYIRSYKKPDKYKGKGISFYEDKTFLKPGKQN